MNKQWIGLALLGLALASGGAQAKGCLEGAAVGGVAGHVAGKHGVIGAAGGCAIGHHEAGKKEKEQEQQQQQQQTARAAPAAGGTTAPAPAPAKQ